MLFITVLCLNQVMLIGRDSKNPDVDSKDPWPRRGFVRLIGLVSMHLIMLALFEFGSTSKNPSSKNAYK